MANFNTNQTRHFYVAKAIDSSVDTNGDIYLKTAADGKFYFSYKNPNGLLTRTDLIDPKCVSSLKASLCHFNGASVDKNPMDIPLIAHTVALNTSAVDITSPSVIGKDLTLFVTVHGALSYDASDSLTFPATVNITSSINTAALFHKALAKAIIYSIPGQLKGSFKVFTYGGVEITKANCDSQAGHANGIIIVPCSQSYERGYLSNEPVDISVAFNFRVSNTENIQWGTEAVAPSTVSGCSVIPAVYALADLEYFALGERGEFNRGNWFHKEPKFGISDDDIAGGANYNVLNIEYYWAGGAEDVQKSPRLLQIAAKATASDDIITTLYGSVNALVNADAVEIDSLKTRVTALEN